MTPLIGLAITAFGNQLITTVLITFAVDCNHDEAASVGVYITLVRQTWGFTRPQHPIEYAKTRFLFVGFHPCSSVGVGNSAGIACALIFSCSVIPTILLQWRGQRLSSKSNVLPISYSHIVLEMGIEQKDNICHWLDLRVCETHV